MADSRRQFTGFRVIVYRLRFPDSATVLDNDADKMFSSDFWHSSYDGYVNSIEGGKKSATQFISDTNKNISLMIKAGLVAEGTATVGTAMKSGQPVPTTSYSHPFSSGKNQAFQQIEITPIVTQVDIVNNLEDANTCSISIVDPSVVHLVEGSISSWVAQNPLNSSISGDILKDLKGFQFHEFDLIRVYGYSSTEKSLTDKVAELKNAKIDATMALAPAFTGLLVSSSRSVQPDSMPTISASCMGIMRVFVQSVTVATDATMNVVAEEEPRITTLADSFSVFGSKFQTYTSDQSFEFLIRQYLHPLYIRNPSLRQYSADDAGGTKMTFAPVLGVPDLRKFMHPDDLVELKIDPQDGAGLVCDTYGKDSESADKYAPGTTSDAGYVSKLVPFLPTCVLLHILKTLRREPIAVFDDRLDGDVLVTQGVGSDRSAGTPRIVKNSDSDYGSLKPYLEMIRTNYEGFDSSYMSPASLFGEIRSKTYLEIFEDRTGAFHFRIPRYNQSRTHVIVNPEDAISVSVNLSDSSEYNAVVVKKSIVFNGASGDIPGDVYLDRLSIMRYGFRMPQIEDNPNAVSLVFAKSLSRFLRGYVQGKSARTATITKLFDPTINVGDVVYFTYGPSFGYKIKTASLNSSVQDSMLVGYISSISESLTANGGFTQTLNLSFVRPAFCDHRTSASGSIGKSSTVSDIISSSVFSPSRNSSTRSLEDNVRKITSFAEAPLKIGFDKMSSWVIPNVSSREGIDFSAKHIPDARDLMVSASDPIVNDQVNYASQVRKGKKKSPSASSLAAAMINLEDRKKALAAQSLGSKVIDAYALYVPRVLARAKGGVSAGTLNQLGDNLFSYFGSAVNDAVGSGDSASVTFNVPGKTASGNAESVTVTVVRPQGVIWYSEVIHQLSLMYKDSNKIGTDTFYGDWYGLFSGGGKSEYADPGADRNRSIILLQFAVDNLKKLSEKYRNTVSNDKQYQELSKAVSDWEKKDAARVKANPLSNPARRLADGEIEEAHTKAVAEPQ